MLALIQITPLHWAGFILCVLFFLALDLGVLNRTAHVVKFKEALTWSVIWCVLAMLFAAALVPLRGKEEAVEFVTGRNCALLWSERRCRRHWFCRSGSLRCVECIDR